MGKKISSIKEGIETGQSAEEFAQAIKLLSQQEVKIESWDPKLSISPFERKYKLSKQQLYRLTVNLTP